MHLDILYKTVNFIDKQKIIENLPKYLENKKNLKVEEKSPENSPEKQK